ncbi:sugar transferase, partial [Streptomyces cyaneofuscatus]
MRQKNQRKKQRQRQQGRQDRQSRGEQLRPRPEAMAGPRTPPPPSPPPAPSTPYATEPPAPRRHGPRPTGTARGNFPSRPAARLAGLTDRAGHLAARLAPRASAERVLDLTLGTALLIAAGRVSAGRRRPASRWSASPLRAGPPAPA